MDDEIKMMLNTILDEIDRMEVTQHYIHSID